MSLGSGLFLFVILLCLIIICIAFVPIRLQFYIEHRHVWNGSVVIHVGAIGKTIRLSGQKDADAAYFLQKYYEKWSEKWNTTSHSLQIHWQSVLAFFCKAVQIVTRRISVEQFVIDCKIGCQRADYTAYGYGLFWALLSFVPEKLFRNAEITYIPDFQTVRKRRSFARTVQSPSNVSTAQDDSLVRTSNIFGSLRSRPPHIPTWRKNVREKPRYVQSNKPLLLRSG